MAAYYNEKEPFAAQWLRNLIAAGHIASGEVDTRSISDVYPDELQEFTQCHFFAGIGVWAYALRRAGWSDERPVWTGSCPCQPFSVAGKGLGLADERHLWPDWFHLLRLHRPPVVFGEQVASTDGLAWLELVQDDLEAEGYSFAPFDLCAAGVGAPHIRQRLYWVANTCGPRAPRLGADCWDSATTGGVRHGPPDRRVLGGLADHDAPGRSEQWGARLLDGERTAQRHHADGRGAAGGLGHPLPAGLSDPEFDPVEGSWRWRQGGAAGEPGGPFWARADWLFCRDGKVRPVEPGSFPLAHGATSRVGRLRAYGNAIVAPLAEEFIRAVMEVAP